MTHGEMNIINGPDELLVSGLAAGADAGVGSTYNVMLPQFLQIYDLFKRGEKEKALELLEMVGMSHRKNSKLSQLSGGEQQRVALARALVNNAPNFASG